jgi:hypothetical protein
VNEKGNNDQYEAEESEQKETREVTVKEEGYLER